MQKCFHDPKCLVPYKKYMAQKAACKEVHAEDLRCLEKESAYAEEKELEILRLKDKIKKLKQTKHVSRRLYVLSSHSHSNVAERRHQLEKWW